MLLDVSVSAMVAGDKAGAGADEVVCVRDIAERDLSRNSTIAVAPEIALYRLSIPGARDFSRGTTRLGTVPVGDILKYGRETSSPFPESTILSSTSSPP